VKDRLGAPAGTLLLGAVICANALVRIWHERSSAGRSSVPG